MDEKRFSDLNDLESIIEELEQKIDEQQAIITELERKLKKYNKIGEEQLKQIIDLQDKVMNYQEEIKRLKCMNNQLKRRLDYSIAYMHDYCGWFK